ncbi:hypothetical protein [Tenacibaculum sp. 190524A02b]|uniref:hypothetical protein n=1 Tax=Tenacibaculum vairaonense TaxID=3137860 RepID=UPI0031FB0E02
MSKSLDNLSLDEAREMLLSVWTKCEFGVKERVKNILSHRTIHYILSTPTYSNREKIISYIKTIKKVSGEVKEEVNTMFEEIQERIKV